MRNPFILLFILFSSFSLKAQEKNSLAQPNYQLASKFSPEKLKTMIFSTTVNPNWINHTDRFWYEYSTSNGKKWYVVNPATRSKNELFDNADLAAKVTKIVKNPFDAQNLNIQNLKFTEDEKKVRFQVQSTKDTVKSKEEIAKLQNKSDTIKKKLFYLEYDLSSKSLIELSDKTKEKTNASWATFSPDTMKVYFAKNYNLYWMDKENYEKALKNEKDSTIIEHQITKDGIQYYAWGGDQYSITTGGKVDEELSKRKSVWLSWSPDGKYFSLTRKDNRQLSPLWVINNVGDKRPTLETYKYLMPGELDSTEAELHVFDAEALTSKRINVAAYKNQTLSMWTKDADKSNFKGKIFINYWLGNSNEFYVARSSRDLKKIDILIINATTGNIKTVAEERSNVYLDVQKPTLLSSGNQLIHWSQRDGWGHFYLYNKDGQLVNQITSGAYNTVNALHVDELTKTLYFTANGRENNEDPYYEHLYRINLNGSGIKLLNSGNFDHQIEKSPSGKFYVDNFSRVNTIPTTSLYGADGSLLLKLEEADLSQLFAAGYQFPTPFKLKAADGYTDLYGVMYKPYDFDSTKTYPLLEYVYPGPQTEAVNKSFGRSMDRIDRIAQAGFIVVTVGNRGGHPGRSKYYHTYGYGNLRDYGLEDKKVVAEQLANKHSFIDIDRVGIFGHSGGGFMSTAAMLVYPDFFKVAVSSAGNHQNDIYNRWWSERHHGVSEKVSVKGDTTFSYQIEKNTELAKNLKGHLLLATGDIDNNVHPANTIRMADALIKANKRFEFLLLPGQRHGFGDMTEYFFWKMTDYFAEHLLGSSKSKDVDIMEMNREKALKR